MTQRGLPAGLQLEVHVVETSSGRKLGEADTVSTAAGTIDVRLTAPLRGVRQVVVEVERRSDETELGEVGADLPQPCSTAPASLQPVLSSPDAVAGSAAATPAVAPSGAPVGEPSPSPVTTTDQGRSWLLLALLLIAGGLAVVAGAYVGRRGRVRD